MPSIGLLGGSFDPVHHGHLIVARVAAESLGLDELRFLPAREQPFKQGRHAAPAVASRRDARAGHRGEPRLRGRARGARACGPLLHGGHPGGPSRSASPRRPSRCCSVPTRPPSSTPGTGRPTCRGWRGSWCSRRPGTPIPSSPLIAAAVEVPAVDISATEIRRRVRAGRADPLLGARRRGRVYGPAPLIFGPRMIKNLMTAVFGTRFDRERRRIQPVLDAIHAEEERLRKPERGRAQGPDRRASARAWPKRTVRAQGRARRGPGRPSTPAPTPRSGTSWSSASHELELAYKKALAAVLDELLPEAFATVREACRRLLGTTVQVTGHDLAWDMVPYDVQLIGGIVLHQGKIAEMATGEGKTLVATLPLYLNALTGTRRAPGHGQQLPGPPRLAVDGARLQVPRPHRRLPGRHRARPRPSAAPPTWPTSPTAPTTSSASTTCATTWCSRSSSGCSGSTRTRSSTRWTRSSSTRRGRRSSSRARWATRPTTSTASSTGRSRSWCGSRPASSTRCWPRPRSCSRTRRPGRRRRSSSTRPSSACRRTSGCSRC